MNEMRASDDWAVAGTDSKLKTILQFISIVNLDRLFQMFLTLLKSQTCTG
jgi:hypothetical protein